MYKGEYFVLKSMTAFGRATAQIDGREITVEIRSVNNRFLDCTVKLPRIYSFLEERVKAYVSSRGVTRGKVEVYIGIESHLVASRVHPSFKIKCTSAPSFIRIDCKPLCVILLSSTYQPVVRPADLPHISSVKLT